MELLKSCNLCPRNCQANRIIQRGFCGADNHIYAAKASLHFWEEPCISGTRGSGTVFFSGCNLRCVYCQNNEISLDFFGKKITPLRLSEIFLELQNLGAHNINLVTPTPYVLHIAKAIELAGDKIKIPFIYNTSGYETPETINFLRKYIDIFITDIKYFSPALSRKYSAAPDYFGVAFSAAKQMINQLGQPQLDKNGIMQSGVIIRHLVLPSHKDDSIEILNQIAKGLPKNSFILSLMSQYTPSGKLENFPELQRRITSFEYSKVVDAAISLGINNGYMQDRSGANTKYIPVFDLSGL